MSPARRAYMLIFRDTTPEVYERMSDAETREQLDRWNGWLDGLSDDGRLLDGRPLEEGGVVVSAAGAQPMDGPFAEAKELVGGFFLVQVADEREATAIAEQCPLLEYGMTVEVRPVSPVCHLARKLGWQTMHGPVPAA